RGAWARSSGPHPAVRTGRCTTGSDDSPRDAAAPPRAAGRGGKRRRGEACPGAWATVLPGQPRLRRHARRGGLRAEALALLTGRVVGAEDDDGVVVPGVDELAYIAAAVAAMRTGQHGTARPTTMGLRDCAGHVSLS